jgi:DNA-binding transcriptional LysR family regulator
LNRKLGWDDLQLVLAIFRAGTLSGAARALGVTHSTIFRRLGAVEQQLGVRLFDRFRDGYAATPAGEEAAQLAARFEGEVLGLERSLSGQDLLLSGTVRIATADTIGALLMPHLAALRRAHPDIALELTLSNAMANLTRRDADIALRPTADPPETLVGRRLSGIAHAVYGLAGADRAADPWIALDAALAETAIGRWLRRNVPEARIACRVDTLPALCDAARAGLGLALLPCYVGDRAAGLRRAAPEPLEDISSTLWLLTHEDLRRSARIRAVLDFLAQALAAERDLLEGRRPNRSAPDAA